MLYCAPGVGQQGIRSHHGNACCSSCWQHDDQPTRCLQAGHAGSSRRHSVSFSQTPNGQHVVRHPLCTKVFHGSDLTRHAGAVCYELFSWQFSDSRAPRLTQEALRRVIRGTTGLDQRLMSLAPCTTAAPGSSTRLIPARAVVACDVMMVDGTNAAASTCSMPKRPQPAGPYQAHHAAAKGLSRSQAPPDTARDEDGWLVLLVHSSSLLDSSTIGALRLRLRGR